jgi:hypothetical protein
MLVLDGDACHPEVFDPAIQALGVGDVEGDVTWAVGSVGGDGAGLSGCSGVEEQEHVAAGAEECVPTLLLADELKPEAAPESLGGLQVVDVEGGLVDATEWGVELGHGCSR